MRRLFLEAVARQKPDVNGMESAQKSMAGSQLAILDAAAQCFMQSGYGSTSIDSVAAHLGATKGMVYHYYRSKADLFFDVQERGMQLNMEAILPIASSQDDPLSKLEKMCRSHLRNLLENMAYQRVVLQGVEMHLHGEVNENAREKLRWLIDERERFELCFREVLVAARDAGKATFENPSFASKAVLAVLNNVVLWYRPRDGAENSNAIVEECTRFAMCTVNAQRK